MASYIVRLSIEKSFTTRAAADAAWDSVEATATAAGWTVTSSQQVKQ